MHPRDLAIKDFSYLLPEDRVAAFPLAERDQSKLLIYKKPTITQDVYGRIAEYLPENSILIFNNTRVVEARIIFKKATGGMIEIFALEPHAQYPDITTAMQNRGNVWWKCLVGGVGKWKHGQILEKTVVENNSPITLQARIVERSADSFTIEFCWNPPSLGFSEILHYFGVIPIPPYLKRETDPSDFDRYQTIYATDNGSVAAPTAGLHFTEEIFASLTRKNITADFLTLHVGAGTFMPVKSDTISGHQMHAEFMQVDIDFIRRLATDEKKIFAVGTTSLRSIESIYWMGVKCYLNPSIKKNNLEITQWEVYDKLEQKPIPVNDALNSLIQWMVNQAIQILVIKTSILIAPPYKVKIASGLITNFHQPNSTLLLLVAALIGDDWTKVYEYALQNDFRFLSYGDGCLLYA